jgi:hypothetical protein
MLPEAHFERGGVCLSGGFVQRLKEGRRGIIPDPVVFFGLFEFEALIRTPAPTPGPALPRSTAPGRYGQGTCWLWRVSYGPTAAG